jgi:hypothetical protein
MQVMDDDDCNETDEEEDEDDDEFYCSGNNNISDYCVANFFCSLVHCIVCLFYNFTFEFIHL